MVRDSDISIIWCLSPREVCISILLYIYMWTKEPRTGVKYFGFDWKGRGSPLAYYSDMCKGGYNSVGRGEGIYIWCRQSLPQLEPSSQHGPEAVFFPADFLFYLYSVLDTVIYCSTINHSLYSQQGFVNKSAVTRSYSGLSTGFTFRQF